MTETQSVTIGEYRFGSNATDTCIVTNFTTVNRPPPVVFWRFFSATVLLLTLVLVFGFFKRRFRSDNGRLEI